MTMWFFRFFKFPHSDSSLALLKIESHINVPHGRSAVLRMSRVRRRLAWLRRARSLYPAPLSSRLRRRALPLATGATGDCGVMRQSIAR